MRKFIIVGAAVAAFVVPTTAMASAPDGTFNFKANDGARSENASAIGEQSSQITQNGQFVRATSSTRPRPDDDPRLACRARAGRPRPLVHSLRVPASAELSW